MRVPRTIPMLLVAVALASTGCDESDAMGRRDALDDGDKSALVQTFREEAQARLDQVNAEISELEVRAEDATAEAKEELRQQAAALRERSEVIQREIRELAWRSQVEWEEATARIDEALDELRRDLAYLIAPGEGQ